MEASAILQPVVVMVMLNIVMFVWMIATRIPAMNAAGIDAQQAQNTKVLPDLLPHDVNKIAHNYNHLFEQPTVFYALALTIAVLGHVDFAHVVCAWSFTGLRILHSLVQATVDIVMVRFTLFLGAWVVVAVMTIREAFKIF